jgi:hypothetical protein
LLEFRDIELAVAIEVEFLENLFQPADAIATPLLDQHLVLQIQFSHLDL